MAIYALGDLVPQIHPDAFVHPDAVVIGAVSIGAQASVWPAPRLRGGYGPPDGRGLTSGQDGTPGHTTPPRPPILRARRGVGHKAPPPSRPGGDGRPLRSAAP